MKVRRDCRLESVSAEPCMGSRQQIECLLQASPCSHTGGTSFVERSHLRQRRNGGRLVRKALGFSKRLERHEAKLCLSAPNCYHQLQ